MPPPTNDAQPGSESPPYTSLGLFRGATFSPVSQPQQFGNSQCTQSTDVAMQQTMSESLFSQDSHAVSLPPTSLARTQHDPRPFTQPTFDQQAVSFGRAAMPSLFAHAPSLFPNVTPTFSAASTKSNKELSNYSNSLPANSTRNRMFDSTNILNSSASTTPEPPTFSGRFVADIKTHADGVQGNRKRQHSTPEDATADVNKRARNESPVAEEAVLGNNFFNLCIPPYVEISAGAQRPGSSSNRWFLPEALVFHHSSRLKALSLRAPRESDEDIVRIRLPETDPTIFGLFVQWLYHQTYQIPPIDRTLRDADVSVDVQTWLLGDQLQSTQFKNYAMGRIYRRHASQGPSQPITPQDVSHVFEITAAGNSLRDFLTDLFAAHIDDPERVELKPEVWSKVMAKDIESRVFTVLQTRGMRQTVLREKEHYMETTGQEQDSIVEVARTKIRIELDVLRTTYHATAPLVKGEAEDQGDNP